MSTVRITTCKNDSREIVGVSPNNPDFGYIRVEEGGGLTLKGGWVNASSKSALIKGRVEDLRKWLKTNNLTLGSTIPGKVVVRENTEPFYEGQEPKRAGKDGEILTTSIGGKTYNIYRQTEYTTDTNMQDELIPHDNAISSAAKAAQGKEIAVK